MVFLHGCEIKSGRGRPGFEASRFTGRYLQQGEIANAQEHTPETQYAQNMGYAKSSKVAIKNNNFSSERQSVCRLGHRKQGIYSKWPNRHRMHFALQSFQWGLKIQQSSKIQLM